VLPKPLLVLQRLIDQHYSISFNIFGLSGGFTRALKLLEHSRGGILRDMVVVFDSFVHRFDHEILVTATNYVFIKITTERAIYTAEMFPF
jgi:hypothetical protein